MNFKQLLPWSHHNRLTPIYKLSLQERCCRFLALHATLQWEQESVCTKVLDVGCICPNLSKQVRSHCQEGLHAHTLYGKKFFFSRTKQPMILKLSMQHWVFKFYQITSNNDPMLTFDLFQLWVLRHLYGKMLKWWITQKLLNKFWKGRSCRSKKIIKWANNFTTLGFIESVHERYWNVQHLSRPLSPA